jgi:hypothetical protein
MGIPLIAMFFCGGSSVTSNSRCAVANQQMTSACCAGEELCGVILHGLQ